QQAASRKAMNLDIKYVVADGRFLPFRNGLFDFVYSYRVARAALLEIGRLLDMGGTANIQMVNKWGIRSIQQQARRQFHQANNFEMRYWSVCERKSTFSELIGEADISADCYLGGNGVISATSIGSTNRS